MGTLNVYNKLAAIFAHGLLCKYSNIVVKAFCFQIYTLVIFFAIYSPLLQPVFYFVSTGYLSHAWGNLTYFDLKSQSHGGEIDQNFIVKCQIPWVCPIPPPGANH